MRADRIEIEPFCELVVIDYKGLSAVNEHGEVKVTGDIPIEKMHEYMSQAKDITLVKMLEASRFVEDGRKEIWVAFQYIKGSLYIQIKNIYEGDVKLSADRKILSRKEESGHGFGLYSMERITEKSKRPGIKRRPFTIQREKRRL